MPSDLAERVAQACKAHWEDVDMTYWCCPFAATSCGVTVTIDAAYVREKVSTLAKDADLSRFIL